MSPLIYPLIKGELINLIISLCSSNDVIDGRYLVELPNLSCFLPFDVMKAEVSLALIVCDVMVLLLVWFIVHSSCVAVIISSLLRLYY